MLAVIFLFLKILIFCATLLPTITNALPLELKTQAKMHADSPKNSPNLTIGKYIYWIKWQKYRWYGIAPVLFGGQFS